MSTSEQKAIERAKYELEIKIGSIQQTLDSAVSCLQDDDFLQCAIRIEMITNVKFDETLMKIFEAMS